MNDSRETLPLRPVIYVKVTPELLLSNSAMMGARVHRLLWPQVRLRNTGPRDLRSILLSLIHVVPVIPEARWVLGAIDHSDCGPGCATSCE